MCGKTWGRREECDGLRLEFPVSIGVGVVGFYCKPSKNMKKEFTYNKVRI